MAMLYFMLGIAAVVLVIQFAVLVDMTRELKKLERDADRRLRMGA